MEKIKLYASQIYSYLINKFYRSRNLNFDVLSSFFILQVITAVSIVSYTYINNSRTLVDFSNRLMNDISNYEITNITSTFNDVTRSTELGSYLVRDIAKADIKNKDLIQFMMGHLRQFKLVDSVHIATESGYFVQLKRLWPNATFRTNLVKPLPKKATFALRMVDRTTAKSFEIWYYLDDSGNKLDEEIIPEAQINYIPKNRLWYKRAQQMLNNTWTDVFISDVSKAPSVACAIPLFSPTGEFVGVISSAIGLEKLSETLETSSGGLAMIINSKSEVIAHPTEKHIYTNIHDEPKLITVEQLTDKTAAEAYREHIERKQNIHFLFTSNKIEYIALFKEIKNEGVTGWTYLMITPIDNFIGRVKVTQHNTLLICFIILLLSIVVIVLIAKRIANPIHNLSEQADRITNFDLSTVDEVKSGIKEIQKLQDSITRMRKSLASFAKFVPRNLVKKLLDKGVEVKIGGSKKQISIFFSDIANFTSISETCPPEKLVSHLSEYFEEMTEILNNNNGTVDKYIGDAIMAFWGAPHNDASHALHCCTSALLCQRRLIDLNRKWIFEKKPELLTRIGINTGETIVGNIGSSERMNYTVLGHTVNFASKLESTNKDYGTNIIISESTVKCLHDHAVVRPLDLVSISGNEVVPIYELVALKNTDPLVLPSTNQIRFCEAFTKAFRYYLERRWDEAIEIFNDLQVTFGIDIPCEMYIKRCEAFKENPPPSTWKGLYQL